MTQSENDSFSSVEGDNDCPRDFLPVNESLDYVYAMLHESQRRVPFYGWSTSRFIGDPPNFYMQLVPEYPVAARSTFQAQFVTENRGEDVAHGGCIAIAPLEAVLPNDYGWAAEEWEVGTRHPHGTDEGGWRYASSFDDRFRASDRPSCEVRRRLWRRRVRRLSQRGPCGPSPTSANPPAEMDDVAHNADYLRVLTKEMRLAEGLKSRRRAVLASGADWNSEFDTDAEEELRTMTKEHQTQLHQASANRGRVSQRKAYAFESPTEEVAPHFFAGDEGPKDELHFSFHPQSSVVVEEQNLKASFLGVNGHDSSNTLQRNTNITHHLPADISRNASVTFRRHSNSEQDDSQHPVPLDQVPTIERFVSDSGARELSAGPVTDEPLVMLSGEAVGEDDFDAIFKKFVSSKP